MEGDEYPIENCSSFSSSQKLRDENISLQAQLKALQQQTKDESTPTTTVALMETQGKKLEDITNRCRQLLSENQRLRDANACASITGELLVNSSNNDAAVKSKNELLSKQSELLFGELDEAHNAIRLRDQNVNALSFQVSELESSLARLSADKQIAESNALQRLEENRESQNTIDQLKLEVKKTRSRMAAEIDGKKELEEECNSLSSKIAIITDRAQDLQGKLSVTSKETNTMARNLRMAKGELDVTKRDAEDKARTISELESKLSDARDQELDVKEQARKHKEELDDALISCDKAEAKSKLLQDRVDSLTQERIVEAKKMEEFGKVVGDLKKRHISEISLRQGAIDELSIKNANIVSSFQRALREKEDLEKKCNRQVQVHENERAKVKGSIESLTDRIAQAEAQLDCANKENQSLRQIQSELEGRILSVTEEIDDERTNARREKDRADGTAKEVRSLKHAYEDGMAKSQRQVSQMEKDLQIGREQHRKRDEDREADLVALREKLDEETVRYQELIRHKNDLYLQQEAKLSEEREVCHRLLERNKEINRSINALAAEKIELTRIVVEHEDKVECLSHALKDAEAKIVGIGKELSESIQDQQDRVSKERDLRKELRDVKSELDYVRKFGAEASSASDIDITS